MNNGNIRQYRESRIRTAGPGQLVLMVYDGILVSLGRAQRAFEADAGARPNFAMAGDQLLRAQALLDELRLSLDMNAGDMGPLLAELYDVLGEQLRQANLAKDPELIAELYEQFAGLRETWGQIVGGQEEEGPR